MVLAAQKKSKARPRGIVIDQEEPAVVKQGHLQQRRTAIATVFVGEKAEGQRPEEKAIGRAVYFGHLAFQLETHSNN